MPANLSPQYKEAERRYRQATSADEQSKALAEMLALIPKHKGTEKLQADIKRRLAALRKEKGKKAATSRQRPIFVIDVEGAGQVPVLGAPNAGKSALVRALTEAPLQVADYPYTTQNPMPAMMPYEDAQVQLIDTPPASAEFAPPWIAELVRRADAVVLLADLTDPDGWEAPAFIVEQLEARGIELVGARFASAETRDGTGPEAPTDPWPGGEVDEPDETLTIRIPTVLVGNKSDDPGAAIGREALREYFGDRFPYLDAAVGDPHEIEVLRRAIFRALHVIRVYSKEPGKPAERERPWILQEGSTVHDLANVIHHDLAERFRYGKLWGSGRFEGQRVGEDYVLVDQDVVEIHAS